MPTACTASGSIVERHEAMLPAPCSAAPSFRPLKTVALSPDLLIELADARLQRVLALLSCPKSGYLLRGRRAIGVADQQAAIVALACNITN